MPETMALLRLSWKRNRALAAGMAIATLVGILVAIASGPLEVGSLRGKIAIYALICTMLPAALSSIVLFDYSNEGNLNMSESGCSHWLLRMPVHSWKIAAVPVVLKTIWITVLWMLFVFIARYLGSDEAIPLFAPSVMFSAAAISMLVLAWQPFRSGWHRIAALIVAALAIYGCSALVLVAPFINQVAWRPIAVWTSRIGVVLLYSFVVWLLIRSVHTARTNVTGLVPLRARNPFFGITSADNAPERRFRSPRHALIFHDLLQQRGWMRNTFILGVIPAIVIITLFVPLGIPTVVLTLILFGYLAGIAISRMGATGEAVLSVPSYLAASPLSSAAIAWTRFAFPMLLAALVYSFVLLPIAGLACWPSNRATWNQWAAELARQIGSSETFWVGAGWTAAIVIAAGVFMLGRVATCFWFAMSGRPWLTVVMSIVLGLSVLVPLGVLIRWFILQPDFESTRASAMEYAAWIPWIVAALLIAKGVASLAAIFTVSAKRLAGPGDQIKVILIWAMITLGVSASLAMLVPDPRVTFLWCLGFAALSIPLSRVIILPLMVDWSRHR